MSFLTRTLPRSALRLPATTSATVRPFHITSYRSALSESDHDPAARKKAIDDAKASQAKEQQEGKGQWKRELSSNSEHAVKADRGEMGSQDIESMQKEHSKEMEREHEHGKK